LSIAPRLEEIPLGQLATDDVLHRDWRQLAAIVPSTSYFQTPDWIVSWWETVASRPRGTAALVRQGSQLTGLAALARTREPLSGRIRLRVPVLTNAGSGVGADHAGWLGEQCSAAILRQWLSTAGPTLLRGVPMEMGQALGGRLLETQRCPRLTVADLENLMSAKLAKTLRNAQRRLDREGVEFRWVEPGAVERTHLDRLYELNELRRSETGDDPVFDDPLRRAFHERLLDWADQQGGTALLIAARRDEVVGVLYGFSWQRTFAYYQIGWDTRFRAESLGSVLVLRAIEECADRGIEVFDFLRGAEDYKYRFGATDLLEGTFAVGTSTGLAMIGAATKVRARMRRTEG
jgi:CelD/BcsL family acetyltransferase involved in cellulose biosynthesis